MNDYVEVKDGVRKFVLGDVKGESKDPSKNLLGMRSVSDKAGDVLSFQV